MGGGEGGVYEPHEKLGIRTISLPDKIPSAHFCIGGHNPFRVFCNVIIKTRLFKYIENFTSKN